MTIPLPGRFLPLVPGTFRALAHRDFRRLWVGQVVSLSGRWMQSVAQGWLVFRLTGSAFHLGLVGFFTFLPILLFALPAGVAADRLPRRRMLLWTQSASMLLAFALAALTWLEIVQVWHIATLAFLLGTVGALDIPVRQSLLQDLVGREDLPNAIALNSLAFNATRVVGPSIAGFLIAAWGEALVFIINGVTFTAVLAGLLLMEHQHTPVGPGRTSWTGEIRLAFRYAATEPRMRVILALVMVTSIFATPYSILLPAFAGQVLQVGSRGLGFMMGAAGAGACSRRHARLW